MDPLHHEVGAQLRLLASGLCFTCLEQLRFEVIVEEIVAATFLLRLQHKFVRSLQCTLDHFVHLSIIFTEILKAPDPLEQILQLLGRLITAGDAPEHRLFCKTLLILLEGC